MRKFSTSLAMVQTLHIAELTSAQQTGQAAGVVSAIRTTNATPAAALRIRISRSQHPDIRLSIWVSDWSYNWCLPKGDKGNNSEENMQL